MKRIFIYWGCFSWEPRNVSDGEFGERKNIQLPPSKNEIWLGSLYTLSQCCACVEICCTFHLLSPSRQHLPAPLLPISTSAKVQRIIKFEASRERGHDFKQMQEAVKGDTWAGGKDMMTNNNIITYKIFTDLLTINSLYRIKLQRQICNTLPNFDFDNDWYGLRNLKEIFLRLLIRTIYREKLKMQNNLFNKVDIFHNTEIRNLWFRNK